MDESLLELAEYVVDQLGDEGISISLAADELTIAADVDKLLKVLAFLRDDSNCRFRQLIDICGVDYPDREPRFDIIYHLLSHTRNQRVRLRVRVNETTAVPSVSDLFPAADWYEREAWDMYGIMFEGHSDLRRLLTDYGFDGHPLRKDFPLTGYVEVRYDDEQKRVVYEPVTLVQEYRDFDFMSPWEGAQRVRETEEEEAERAEDG